MPKKPRKPPNIPASQALRDADSAARRARREARFGTGIVCPYCGEPDLAALVHGGRTVLEDHHVLTKRLEPDIWLPLCRNDHAKDHERMRNAGVLLLESPSALEAIMYVLRAHTVLFDSLSQSARRWADKLQPVVSLLDHLQPNWRDDLRQREPQP